MIFVDSDVIVDVTRNHPPAMHWLVSNSSEVMGLSGFTVLELLSGCRNLTEQRRVVTVLRRFSVNWLSASGADVAVRNYERLHLSHGIGTFDVLIGQTAIELGLPLHSFNVKHFSNIPGLAIIQPYTR